MKLSLPTSPRVTVALASSALIATAMVTSTGPSFAESARGPEVQQAAASTAPQCGFFRYSVRESRFAAYNHCGGTTVLIHVDVRGGGSGNDFHLCVGPGATQLPGAGPNYLNAYYIGGAGCRSGDRTGHTPH
ncbi:DUF6355 family natural product biosynthesis protein [Streptomyces sp. NBC_00887]|uniref:DUF6355 family natural product biosynthesis protein n=1 Tax=Streptomyces sp. NBC_00887 TaxID=2975859 RepID=UPI003866E9EB|nr:DUF6355 family natural product biosynthesis protein [Streptomyces sp. NBC_00887]WSY36074.1 DUF6355 family natural product biosynthesis protein [Streptomyces sp. NBC_00887]